MRLIVTEHYNDMSSAAARIIASQVILKPDSVLGLATGSTPIGIYEQLAEWFQKGELDFSKVTTVNLDEYYGLAPDNEQSYHYFMMKHFFSRVNLPKGRQFLPDGTNPDAGRECERYQNLIGLLGGIDVQLLGLGHNGHIGFNEPGSVFEKETHCVRLADQTIKANRRFFATEEEVPREAYTMGIKTIMSARRILIVVSGADKADIVKKAFFGPITPQVPASVLQLHPDVTLVADEAALA